MNKFKQRHDKFNFFHFCKRVRKSFQYEMSLEPNLRLILLMIVLPNSIFDIAVLVIVSRELMISDYYSLIISLVWSVVSYAVILLQSMTTARKNTFNHNIRAALASLHLVGILILSLERAIALSAGEVSGYAEIWCCLVFSMVFDFLYSWEIFERHYFRQMFILMGMAYVLTRSLLVWEPKFLILTVPALTSVIKKRFAKPRQAFLSLHELDEIIENKVDDRSRVTDNCKSFRKKEEQENSKKIETVLTFDTKSKIDNSCLMHEKIFKLSSDGFLIFNAGNETLLFKNENAEILLGSDSKEIMDAFKNKIFVRPLLKQDEKINPVFLEHSLASLGRSHHAHSSPNIQNVECEMNEKSTILNTSYNNMINESLAAVIERIKKNILSEKPEKVKGGGKSKINLPSKKRKLNSSLSEFDLEADFSKGDESPMENIPVARNKEVIFRKSLLAETRDAPGNTTNQIVGKIYDVEVTFFEDPENELGSKKPAEELFYTIRIRDLEGEGIVESFQTEIDCFKAQFISTLSHELKTPLNCTINMLELLELDLRELENNSAYIEKLKPALQNSELLVSNINDVIDYSELISNKFLLSPTRFSMRDLLKRLVDVLSTSAKERGNVIHLKYENKAADFIVSDEQRVGQVVLNLLSNANKFTINGEITLKVENFFERGLKVIVKDTGMGIKKGEFKKIGVLGGSKNRKLVGFGLAIANYIASVLGPPEKRGIFVHSRLRRGSTFSFFIDNLQEYKLKRSNLAKWVKSSETFDQLNLHELTNLQNSPSAQKAVLKQSAEYFDEDEFREASAFTISNSESSWKVDQESSESLNKKIDLLGKRNKGLKFMQNLNQLSEKKAPNISRQSKIDLLVKRSLSEENSMSESSSGEEFVKDFKFFRTLFPMPSSVSLLCKKNSRNSNEEDCRSVGKLKISSSGRLSNYNNLIGSVKEKSLSYKEKASIKKNLASSFNDMEIVSEDIPSRPIEKNNTNAANAIEQTSVPNIQFKRDEAKFNNLSELIGSLRKTKTCQCPELLLVDDNGYNLVVLRLMTERLGLRVDLAKSGDEAISMVKTRASGAGCADCRLYYVILMDIDMPEKDGLQTTAEILELFANESIKPVVIACTAFHERELWQKCFSVGMKDFISKPVKRDLLEKMLFSHFACILS